MTEEQAIQVLKIEQKCISRNDGVNCDRKCESCDLVLDVSIIRDAFNTAIEALYFKKGCEVALDRAFNLHGKRGQW